MIADLLAIDLCCALFMLAALVWLDRRGFFVAPLDPLELVALSVIWPLGLLLIAAEWVISRRGHR